MTYFGNHAPETSGLEEAAQVRGKIDHQALLDSANDLLVANASTSIPNANGYEGLVAVQHLAASQAQRLRTFVFPGAQLQHCLVGTPYRPEMANLEGPRDGYNLHPDSSLVEKNLAILPNNPVARLRNMIGRAVEKRLDNEGREIFADLPGLADIPSAALPAAIAARFDHDPRVGERLSSADRLKLTKYLLDLPAGIFMTDQGQPFVDRILEQRLAFVRTLGEMMLNGQSSRLAKLSVEEITPYLENVTLADLSAMLGPEFDRKVAFTFCCAECSMSAEETARHFVLFDGSIYQNMGQIKNGNKVKKADVGRTLRGCKMLGGQNGSALNSEKLLSLPVAALARAGFMLSGAGIYAAISRVVARPEMTLSIVNYKPARGTVAATARLWPGPMVVSPKINIFRDGRDASQWELQDYLASGGAERDRFMEFARSIPAVSDGRIHDLHI